MAITLATFRSAGKGKFIVQRPGGPVEEFTDFDKASARKDEIDAEILAAQEKPKNGALILSETYRKGFEVRVPSVSNYPLLDVVQNQMDALIEHWPSIVATYKANRGSFAPTYQERPKAITSGDKPQARRLDIVKVELETK